MEGLESGIKTIIHLRIIRFLAFSGVACAIFVHDTWVPYFAGLLLLLCVGLSCQVNRSLLKPMLAFLSKFGLPLLTLFSGVFALGSASRLLKCEAKDIRDTARAEMTPGHLSTTGYELFRT